MDRELQERLLIRELIENWAIWRDAGDWERFRTVWHDDDLERRLGIPRSLREIGMPEDGIERAVELITASPYWNPRPVDAASLRLLLQRASNGDPPQPG